MKTQNANGSIMNRIALCRALQGRSMVKRDPRTAQKPPMPIIDQEAKKSVAIQKFPKPKIKRMTISKGAYEVLKKAKKPLHIEEIHRTICAKWGKVSFDAVQRNLINGDEFLRVGAGTYALLEDHPELKDVDLTKAGKRTSFALIAVKAILKEAEKPLSRKEIFKILGEKGYRFNRNTVGQILQNKDGFIPLKHGVYDLAENHPESKGRERVDFPKAVHEILKEAKKPLHLKEIRKRISAKYYEVSLSAVQKTLFDRDKFWRVGQGTYALVEDYPELKGLDLTKARKGKISAAFNMAYVILKDAAKPLHIQEIKRKIEAKGFKPKIRTLRKTLNERDEFLCIRDGIYILLGDHPKWREYIKNLESVLGPIQKKRGPCFAAIHDVLQSAGKPLHFSVILKRVNKKGHNYTENSIRGTLGEHVEFKSLGKEFYILAEDKTDS